MSFLSGLTPAMKNPGTTPGGCHQSTFVEVTGNTCNALLLSGILDNITMAPFIQELHIEFLLMHGKVLRLHSVS